MDGIKSYPEVTIDFSPLWWNKNYGFEFDEAFWLDPIRRTEQTMEMQRVLFDRFGDVGLGCADPTPTPNVEMYGHRFVSALLGAEIRYYRDQPPSVLSVDLDYDHMGRIQCPILSESKVFTETMRQAALLIDRYGFCNGEINMGGPLNVAVTMFGTSFLAALLEASRVADHVLSVIANTMINLYDELTCKISPTEHNSRNRKLFLGNCPVIMISPDHYQTKVFPHDQWLRSQAAVFTLHHCGSHMERYLSSYTHLRPISHIEVGWEGDLRLVAEAIPEATITPLLYATELAGKTELELDDLIGSILQSIGNPARISRIWIVDWGPELDDSIVRSLRSYAERL
ncbi:MAG: hypothetical protein HPY90_07825 [Syntrophothermus sp.]|uniref:hypothetical protein n=1 Tax=Syntrophothermus sp. TaxID=2736299 RepID=UPI0025808130|nr:hypothetical protein [Syntrophothermus sp.]NSW83169.1 hypothetical protein [Syntrophothermus sp.]